jgi:phosphoribosylglycinamide formyltransferase-1|tara:strand:- start:385 stop:984 length:600 start_codon:yes stop_codon:yes gene_type:complete
MIKKKLKYQVKLNGKKIKTCVFISGSGTNLKSLINYSRNYNFPANISLVISNNVNAKGLLIAKKHGIKYKFFSPSNKKKFERACLLQLRCNKIKLLCLAGFMQILSKKFINTFGYKIINIHPSLLPKYKGLNTHKRVLRNKEKYSGCTVHYVNDNLDSGKIILKKRVYTNTNDTEETLRLKILNEEHSLYPKSIISMFK